MIRWVCFSSLRKCSESKIVIRSLLATWFGRLNNSGSECTFTSTIGKVLEGWIDVGKGLPWPGGNSSWIEGWPAHHLNTSRSAHFMRKQFVQIGHPVETGRRLLIVPFKKLFKFISIDEAHPIFTLQLLRVIRSNLICTFVTVTFLMSKIFRSII